MASTYNDKDPNLANGGTATSLAAATTGTTPVQATGSSLSKPVSNALSNNAYGGRILELSGAANGYTPNDNVLNAKSYLDQVIASRPGAYENKYTNQLSDLYNQILNRNKFSYDMNSDMLYQQYSQQYKNLGRQAMRDTTGQAAANTGGYASSYATTAGNSAYQQYLGQLAAKVPELQEQALQRYQQQGEQLQQRYNVVQGADESAYNRYRDQLQGWQQDRSYAQSAYDTAYSQDYNDYTNRVGTAESIAKMEQEDASAERSQAYSYALAMVQAGVMPSTGLMEQAGLTAADVKKLVAKYKG